MKLNPDCIRDILLTVEEVTDFYNAFEYPDNEYERLVAYSKGEVIYHIEQCNKQKFLIGYEFYMSQSVGVEDLSPEGHEFINVIRSDTNWNKINGKLSSLAAISIPILVKTAIDYGKTKF